MVPFPQFSETLDLQKKNNTIKLRFIVVRKKKSDLTPFLAGLVTHLNFNQIKRFYSLNSTTNPNLHVGKRFRSKQVKLNELCTFEQQNQITFY